MFDHYSWLLPYVQSGELKKYYNGMYYCGYIASYIFTYLYLCIVVS